MRKLDFTGTVRPKTTGFAHEMEIPGRGVFDTWQIAQYLNTPHRLGALGHVADEETHRMFREHLEEEERTREDARNLMLLEWAKELLEDDRS